MNVRKWDVNKDYDILVKWWDQWDFGRVPKDCLPPLGIVVEYDNVPICAGGLYIGEGTQFGFMEWIVVDKNANLRQAHKALGLCIDNIIDLAKEEGCKLVYTVTGETALHKRYTKYHGMELKENNTKTFLRDFYNDYDHECFTDHDLYDERMKVLKG